MWTCNEHGVVGGGQKCLRCELDKANAKIDRWGQDFRDIAKALGVSHAEVAVEAIRELKQQCEAECARQTVLRDTKDELESARDAAKVEETLRHEAEERVEALSAQGAALVVLLRAVLDEKTWEETELEPEIERMTAAYALAQQCDGQYDERAYVNALNIFRAACEKDSHG